MRARFRTLTPPINLEILDMIEEGDRVAVRWQLTATHDGKLFEQSTLAIYRFEDGRIAEDRGISSHALWSRQVLSTDCPKEQPAVIQLNTEDRG